MMDQWKVGVESDRMEEYLERMKVPKLLWLVELDRVPQKQKRIVLKYINELPKYLGLGWGLLMWGVFGSGKSGAAAVILKFGVTKQKRTGLWVFADDIPGYVIEKISFDQEETYYDRMLSVDLLVIDELLFKNKKDSFADTVVEMVFRRRLAQKKSTIFTSNIGVDTIRDEYPALHSVMTEVLYPVQFTEKFREKIAETIKRDFQNG